LDIQDIVYPRRAKCPAAKMKTMRSILLNGLFFGFSLLLIIPCANSADQAHAGHDLFNYDLFSISKSDKLHLNKNARQFVRNYIKHNRRKLFTIEKRSRSPFIISDSVFTRYQMPDQLKYLSVIESELNANAVSHVGAVGPWQLMPATARILGLKVSRGHDERTQFGKSTKAAAKYLRDLHREFGDWLLVVAAYNGGANAVNRAIRRSGSHNFWLLQNYLPAESRCHVKKFLATMYFFEGQTSVTNFCCVPA
jgi:membrane-bound lytic murein transglycosylase D